MDQPRPHAPMHRCAERKPVVLNARCATTNGMRENGRLFDLSTHGCCVTTNSLYLSIGKRVIIKADGLEAISGIVRWIEDGRAGVQFDAPLYGPVVDHLTRQQEGARVGLSY